MSKTRKLRNNDELEAAAGHVAYEIRTMIEAAERIPRIHLSSPATFADDDIALESFLLHFRNLRSFLCPSLHREVHAEDVLASDFLGKEKAEDVADPQVLGREQRKLNALLAHISYDRREYVRAGDKNWPVQQMRDEMLRALAGFFDTLPIERRQWFLSVEILRRALFDVSRSKVSEHATTTTITVKKWLEGSLQ